MRDGAKICEQVGTPGRNVIWRASVVWLLVPLLMWLLWGGARSMVAWGWRVPEGLADIDAGGTVVSFHILLALSPDEVAQV
jgi:hypothetical protein